MKLFSQTKLINLILLIGLLILISSSLLSYYHLKKLIYANQRVIHTYQVLNAINQTLFLIEERESKVNYYAMSRQPIPDVDKLTQESEQHILVLKELTIDNPGQQQKINQLEKLLIEKFNSLEHAMRNTANDSQAIQKYALGKERQQLKTKITELINDISQDEVLLLEKRNTYDDYQIKISNQLYIFAGIASSVLFIISILILNYYLHRRNVLEQKQIETEKELKLSEERFLLTTEGSRVGIWDWYPGTDYVYFGPFFRKLIGYTEEEFPNSIESFNKIVHPEDYNRVWDAVNLHLEKHVPFRIEYRLKTKSGEYEWFLAGGQAQWDQNGKATRMSGSINNISDRKKIEGELEIQYIATKILADSTNLEQAAAEIIKEICRSLDWDLGTLWLVDPDSNRLGCVGTSLYAKKDIKSFEEETKQTFLPKGKGLPGRIWEKGAPDWISDIAEDKNFARSAAKKAGFHSTFGLPILVQNNVLGVIEFFTTKKIPVDYSLLATMMTIGAQLGQFIKRKNVEKKLIENSAYQFAILEAVNDCILTVDVMGNILSFNSETLKEFNYTAAELKKIRIKALVPEWNIRTMDKNKKSLESTGTRKTGDTFPIEISLSQMTNNDEILVVNIRDITERKRVETLKNEFISVVSHELRTPLTSIKGSLALILGGAAGHSFDDKSKKLLHIAESNCERLLTLINDILDLEKIESGKMVFKNEIINATDLVKEAVEENKGYASNFNINLQSALLPTAVNIKGDFSRLLQVLANLISNAVKFSPPNEIVNIAMEQKDMHIRISVTNKGEGIPLEFQSRIFEKFSQADSTSQRTKGGTGLGLNISKNIINSLGGTLNFESIPNQYTTFYIELPILKDEVASKKVKDELQSMIFKKHQTTELPENRARLLICDKDKSQADKLRTLLHYTGFIIDTCYEITHAKELLLQNEYHALLLDLDLTKNEGMHIVRDIRNTEKLSHLPIIMMYVNADLTGSDGSEKSAFALTTYLDKPLNYDKLISRINDIKTQSQSELIHILHVEDDNDTREIIHELLKSSAEVDYAQCLKETLEKIKDHKYDLIILDLLLPDGNGIELLPLFSEYKIPVVVYSAYELDQKYTDLVKAILVKSKASNESLMRTIKIALDTGV